MTQLLDIRCCMTTQSSPTWGATKCVCGRRRPGGADLICHLSCMVGANSSLVSAHSSVAGGGELVEDEIQACVLAARDRRQHERRESDIPKPRATFTIDCSPGRPRRRPRPGDVRTATAPRDSPGHGGGTSLDPASRRPGRHSRANCGRAELETAPWPTKPVHRVESPHLPGCLWMFDRRLG